MALRPHWLDDVFADPDKFTRGEKAFVAAKEAFERTKEEQEKNPQLVGPSPGQAARQAFLKALDLSVEYAS